MREPVLEAVEVSRAYPRHGGLLRRVVGAVVAVDRVSLAIRRGDTVGLVGESGCGKTTLAKLLMGLLPPTGGETRIQGRPVTELRGRALLAARRSVQMIFQNPLNSLDPRMTVEESLE